MTQQLFGYKLSAPDGSESKWVFINNNDQEFSIWLRAKNGAVIKYMGYADGIIRWASPRELKVSTCVFDFDPVAMAFTREM